MENPFPFIDSPLPFTILLFLLVFSITAWKNKTSETAAKLPPGPPKLPLIGHLHLFFKTLPHFRLRDLANKYGPLMLLQFGEVPTFFVSSPETAREVMKTHDLAFADRPRLQALTLLTYNFSGVGFTSYGDHWRQMRKICGMELLNMKRVQSFGAVRSEEVSNLIRFVSANDAGSTINVRNLFSSLALSIFSRAAFGGKSKHMEEFKQLIPEILPNFGLFNAVDFFPSSKLLRLLNACTPKTKKLHQHVDGIIENIILEHRSTVKITGNAAEAEPDDLLSVLLSLQDHGNLEIPLTTENIKAVILELFLGGGETSVTLLEWTMAELMKNPRVMEKTQAEVRNVFSKRGNTYDETGLSHELKYMNLVIKETLRLHAPIPLLAPRESRWKCEINGYEIPAQSRIVVNAWAIGRDPKYWEEPEKFYPERMVDRGIDYNGSNFEFLPFGSGRRMCPGVSFGIANIELVLANLLYHFDWKLPDGMKPEDLDMTEVFGTAATRKDALCLIPIPYHPNPYD